MNTFEWFLLVIVVIGVPLVIAVVVTLWTLEQARQRKRANRPGAAAAVGVKRKATREPDALPVTQDATGEQDHLAPAVPVANEALDGPDESLRNDTAVDGPSGAQR